jgi:DNA polymerase-3 subunit delta
MPNVLILHGEDDFSLEESFKALIAGYRAEPNADLNTAEFEGSETSVAEILSAASAFPFMASRRLVIVRGLLSFLTRKGAGEGAKKSLEYLTAALPTLPDWSQLVFIERGKLPESSKIVKTAAEQGEVRLFSPPKDSADWISKRAKSYYGTSIDSAAAHALASVTQNDLRLADSELAKLAAYLDGGRPITEDDVALLTPYVAEANIFNMVDALGAGNGRKAARLAHQLLEQQEDIFALFGMINRQFRLLLLVKEHLNTGGSRDKNAIAGALGINPFVADKLSVQSRSFSLLDLEGIYRALQDYDVKMKTGRIDPVLALDLLIAALSR